MVAGRDATDEDAIAVARSTGGPGVRMGEGPSLARVRVPEPAQVRTSFARAAG